MGCEGWKQLFFFVFSFSLRRWYTCSKIYQGPEGTNKPLWAWPASPEASIHTHGPRKFSPWALLRLYLGCAGGALVFCLATAMPASAPRAPQSGPQPTDWLPGLASALSSRCGPAWCSLDLTLTLTYGLTSQLDLRLASTPWYLLMIWTPGWTWPPSLGQSCLPCLGAVGLGPATQSYCSLTRPEAPRPGYNLF